ncbi:MAG: ribonuclease III domain-containing protein [Candidatus Gastranaerophilaceae bacterium]
MIELNIKNYAHIGDAFWELFVREKTVFMTENLKRLHEITVSFVNAEFQTKMLDEVLIPILTEDELALIKRGGNIKISSLRKINRNLHRKATEFEVLIGYYYLHDKSRLNELLSVIEPYITVQNLK